jgi:two-component system LytT family sensor kinase
VDADVLAPIRINGRLAYAISIERSPEQRGFLLSEISFLRSLGHTVAAQVELVRAQREKTERDRQEANLRRQATEAELRALRAQVDPHFLFNALNTIADLIVVDSRKAEQMTERLAEVFRYVLSHNQRQTITIREEMEFLRRYLDIEEARFRERLKVRFAVDPSVAEICVPALILQPVVENAIKHGLAPQIEGGALAISAHRENGCLQLVVEDDGAGLASSAATGAAVNGGARIRSTGLGLGNVAERLRARYGERAELRMESPGEKGCRVTIKIPA